MRTNHHIPRFTKALFKALCNEDYYEELQGDIEEEFYLNIKEKGVRYAKWAFRREVFFLIRPSVIKRMAYPSLQLTTGSMLSNYIITAIRNIKKGALFSGINIVGLSLSMAVGLLLISGIAYVFSFDQFHENKHNTYRVITHVDDAYFGSELYATSSVALAPDFFDGHEGVEKAIRMNKRFGGIAYGNDKEIALSGLYADAGFFDIFSFELLSKASESVLHDPFSIVLSDQLAQRFFDDKNPIGEALDIEGVGVFQVTGVVETPPANSHMQFESLVSYSTLAALQNQGVVNQNYENYDNLNAGYVYVHLNGVSSKKEIEQGLNEHAAQISEQYPNQSYSYELQAITSIVPGISMYNQIGPEMETLVLIIFSILAGIIVLSTCFNYTNLSVARALSRTKEIAVRKTLGGTRSQVFLQFIIEAIVISLLALVFAVALSQLAKPYIYNIDVEIQQMFSFQVTPLVVLYFVIFAVIVGVLAGLLPALILSKQEAMDLLRGNKQFRLFRFLNLRKGLIIFQFTLSLVCIIVASITMKQFKFSTNFDLGFDRGQILNVQLQGVDHEVLKNELLRIPEVNHISMSSGILAVGNRNRRWISHTESQDSTLVNNLTIDSEYITNHAIPLLAGRNFSDTDYQNEERLIIANKKLLEEFNLGSPGEALGKYIYTPRSRVAYRIIGVTEDFHYDRLREPIGSFFFTTNPAVYNYANLKVSSSDMVATMAKIETAWENVNTAHDLEAEFYDERIEEAYSFYLIAFGVVGFVTLLTISIACMGLLGIVLYTSKSRTKEIAIRKVLGAEERGLVYLLSKNFIVMMAWATLISVTLTYVLFQMVILPNQAYSSTLTFWDFAVGVFIIVGIGLLTVTSQTMRVARANPVDAIQNE